MLINYGCEIFWVGGMSVWNGDRINGHKVETTFSATGWARQDDGSLVVDFGTATREQMACLKSVDID